MTGHEGNMDAVNRVFRSLSTGCEACPLTPIAQGTAFATRILSGKVVARRKRNSFPAGMRMREYYFFYYFVQDLLVMALSLEQLKGMPFGLLGRHVPCYRSRC